MKRSAVALAVLVLVASSAFAVGDQGPNMLGFYFDTDATVWFDVDESVVARDIYLVLTNPTVGEIVGWEAAYDVYGSADLVDSEVFHAGVNSAGGTAFEVVYPSPLPCDGPTVLASITVIAWDNSENCIMLFGVDAPSVPGDLPVLYLEGGAFLQAETCVFEGSQASAQYNGDGPVIGSPWPCEQVTPVSGVSWSALKGLFR